MVTVRRHLALLLAAGLAAAAMDDAAAAPASPRSEEGRPFIRSFRPRDLGPEIDAGPQFFAVCQDPRGLLYFANNAGVLEHDGATWRKIPLANESHALSCDVDRAGRVWIGGSGTFGYLAPDGRGRLRFVELTGLLPEADRNVGDVWQTSVTPEGVVFRSPFSVVRVAGERVETWKAGNPENGHVYHVGAAVGGRVYVRKHLTGLLALEREGLRLVPGGERFAEEQIYAYLPFDGGRLLLGMRTGELLVYDPRDGSVVPFPTEATPLLREGQIYHAAALADGTFAIATIRAGVAVADRQGRLLARFDRSRGLRDDSVLFAFPDREGNLWLGLNDGLSLVEHPSPLSWFGEESGLKGRVESVIRHRGSLYAATNLGLFRLLPASGPGGEAGFERVAGIDIDAFDLLDSGQGLLCAADDGLYEVEGDRARFLFKSNAHDLDLSIAPGPPRLFISTLGGVVVTERTVGGWGAPWRFKQAEDDVLRAVEAAPWELWAGTAYRGAVRIRYQSRDGRITARRVERFGEAEGLPKGAVQPFRIAGRIVFATQRGVFVLDEAARRFVPDPVFASALPAPEASVYQMLEEPGGSLWVANERRAVRLVPRDGGYEVLPTALARLPEGTRVTSFWADPDGVVWAGSDDGLFRYDPRLEPGRPAPLAVALRRVTAAGRELFGGSGATAFVLPFAENAVRFELAATSFRDPGRARYQVRLAGLDREWSPWSTETYKDYTNLPWGTYAFEVRAQDAVGRIAEARLAEVRILPPWWGTWWARGLFALAGVALVATVGAAAGRLRTRRLERRTRELEAAVAEKTLQLREASLTDPLTGLRNRRFFDEVAEAEAAAAVRAVRAGEPDGGLVVLLVDLDGFKQINDRHGHQEGDRVLQEAAVRLGRVARGSDHLFRWGGEEFLLVARRTGREEAPELARRVLEAFRTDRTDLGGGLRVPPTCSIGWAPFPWFADEPEALALDDALALADQALYLAKHSGRDQAIGVEPAATAAVLAQRWPDWRVRPLDQAEGTWAKLVRLPPQRPVAVA